MSTLLERARRGENLADLDIVDMHGHFGHYTMPIADMTPEGLVRVMDRIGVASVLVSHMQCVSMHAQLGNDEVLAAMRVCPGRILGYVDRDAALRGGGVHGAEAAQRQRVRVHGPALRRGTEHRP